MVYFISAANLLDSNCPVWTVYGASIPILATSKRIEKCSVKSNFIVHYGCYFCIKLSKVPRFNAVEIQSFSRRHGRAWGFAFEEVFRLRAGRLVLLFHPRQERGFSMHGGEIRLIAIKLGRNRVLHTSILVLPHILSRAVLLLVG